jgi:hypothetical protein
MQWLEAFDKISLADVRKTAKATGVQPLRDAFMTLLCLKLEELLGPVSFRNRRSRSRSSWRLSRRGR